MIEIERKFRLSPAKAADIKKSLEAKGASTPIHQIDQVFLQGISSFKDFKPGMPVIRLRTVNGKTQLTYKRAINDAGDTLEHELAVESAEIMQKIIEEMGYTQVTLVDKTRIEVKQGGLTLVLDKVARLGDFLELEILAEEADSGDAEERILQAAAEFSLTPSDIEPKKYDQLVSALRT
ncbi:MAG TPA: class IV adenylate cyclase [Candidatus Saccharimonadales bacterium]|nr:class IV adenylate cyclase [Candidatus Saccharimonadales bacterium]